MITFKDILNYAIIKGLDYEIHAPQSYMRYGGQGESLNEYNTETYYRCSIGINTSFGIWFWFRVHLYDPEELSMDMHMHFVERYNQKNGQSIKGWKTGWKMELKIEELTKPLF